MRIRITQRLTGSIDGIQLDRFTTGYVYEVGTSLAAYLLASGAATPVADDAPALVVPLNRQKFGPGQPQSRHRTDGVRQDQAAERRRGKKDKKPT